MEGVQRQNAANVKPPRKPLTPYMRFSKSIWQSVKVSNPSMSVCEIGATIGKMWRELTDEQKQKFNEDFVSEKAKYDEELAHYLKITGLQASDLVKSKSKKKDSNKNNQNNQASSQAPTPPMMAMPNAQMAAMHHMAPPGYPGNAGHMMAPPGFSQGVNSTVPGALPHFSQIWASSQYEQNMQMNLMAMNAHQNMMEGRPNGQHQFNFAHAQHAQQQHAQAAQQHAQAQHAQAQQHAQEQVNSMSPMYNGSPQMSQSASPHMHNSSPLSSQPSNTPSSAEQQQQQHMQQQFEAMRENGGSNSNQNQHHGQQPNQHQQNQQQQSQPHQNQHNQQAQGQQGHATPNNQPGGAQWPWPGGPPGQERQFASQDQNGHHSNGANGMPPQQPPQSQNFESQPQPGGAGNSQSPGHNSRPPSVAASDHMDSSNPQAEKKEDEKPPQAQTPDKPQPSPAGSADSNPGSSDSQKKSDNGPVMTTSMGAATTQSPFPSYPSAHNVFNSFGNFNQGPWAQHAANAANRQGKEGTVFNRESILETELSHLRSALSEKTKEVQRLTQELDKAHSLIQQLQADKIQH